MRARFVRLAAALQALLLMATLVVPGLAAATEISTDLWIYQDGDTVTVTGIDFGANEVVDLVTTDPEATVVDAGAATTDGAGGFTYQFVLNVTVGGIYDIVATGQTSGLTAATQFDPPVDIPTSTTLTATPGSIGLGGSITLAGTLGWTLPGTVNNPSPVQSRNSRAVQLSTYNNASCSGSPTLITNVTTSGSVGTSPASFSSSWTPSSAGTFFVAAAFAGFDVGSGSNQDRYRASQSSCLTVVVDGAPTVISTNPAGGQTGVSLNPSIVIRFSEPVDVVNWFTISCATSGLHSAAQSGGPAIYTLSSLNPALAPGEICTVTIAAAQVTDQDLLDPPNSLAANFVFQFQILDTAPTVTGTNPSGGATNVPVGANIVVTFSEAVTVETSPAWIDVSCANSGGHGGATTGGGNVWTFNPTTNFASLELCNVQVKFNRVHDTDAIDPPDEMDGHYSFSFTTANANTAPILTVPASPVTAEATSAAGADVTFSVTATDAEDDPDPAPSCDWDSGATFPLGDTLVSCTVTDSGGLQDLDSFTVTVSDATDPVVSITTAEADNGAGWFNIASNDAVAGVTIDVSVTDAVGATSLTCTDNGDPIAGPLDPTGDSFAIGDGVHVIACEATDAAGNAGDDEATFQVDQTAPSISPVISPAAAITGWWNIATGAPTVTYTCDDDGSGLADCTDPYTFLEGADQGHTGTATDTAGNESTGSVSNIDVDLTAPSISAAVTPDADALTGWWNIATGAPTVTYTCDDGLSLVASCTSPYEFAEGADQTHSGEAVDYAGNSASTGVSDVDVDLTAPSITPTVTPDAAGTGWWNIATGAPTVTYGCSDGTSGIDSCSDAHLFGEGEDQAHSGTAVDVAGNTNTAGVSNIDVDLTAPTVALVGGPAEGGSYYFGFVPAAPTCTASDALSGLAAPCSVSGYGTTVGGHTVTASATDEAGNGATDSNTYTVLGWTLTGFYNPVDMNGVVNVVKGGSTVPLKFEVFAGSTELTSTAFIGAQFISRKVSCADFGTTVQDDIEITTTGGTSFRYDTTGGQFIQNWQTPKQAGTCWVVTMTTDDGSYLAASFKLK